MESVTLVTPDIACNHCKQTIERVVGALTGVQSCSVEVTSRKVLITYDEQLVALEKIKEVLEDEGFLMVK